MTRAYAGRSFTRHAFEALNAGTLAKAVRKSIRKDAADLAAFRKHSQQFLDSAGTDLHALALAEEIVVRHLAKVRAALREPLSRLAAAQSRATRFSVVDRPEAPAAERIARSLSASEVAEWRGDRFWARIENPVVSEVLGNPFAEDFGPEPDDTLEQAIAIVVASAENILNIRGSLPFPQTPKPPPHGLPRRIARRIVTVGRKVLRMRR